MPADQFTIIRRMVSPGQLDAEIYALRGDDGNDEIDEGLAGACLLAGLPGRTDGCSQSHALRCVWRRFPLVLEPVPQHLA